MKKFIPAAIFFSAISLSAQAATLDDVVNSINGLRNFIAGAVVTSANTFIDLMYENNPSLPTTITGNQEQKDAINTMNVAQLSPAGQNLKSTKSALKSILTDDEKNSQKNYLATLTASDTVAAEQKKEAQERKNVYTLSQTQVIPQDEDNNFNLDTLLTPISYTPQIQKQATNFVQLVGGLYQPVSAIPLKSPPQNLSDEQVLRLQADPEYLKYLIALRTYVAAQSVGTSNLYQLLSERTVSPSSSASPLQVEQFLANRRSQNKDWYQQMATASPATVQRETLFTLAEIRNQLFQMQLQNERVLATLSVMELQSTQASKKDLQPLEENVKQQINKIKGIPNQ